MSQFSSPNSRKKRLIACLVITLFTSAGIQAPAYAAMVGTDQLAASSELQAKRHNLSQRLMRDDIKKQMLAMGVDTQQVQKRINSLTASEISQIQGKLDSLPAGGDALGTVALVLLILILLDIAGVTDIFPGV